MSLYYVEDANGVWQWVSAADPRHAAEQVAEPGCIVVYDREHAKGYPIARYRVQDRTGRVVGRLDVTPERYLVGVEGGEG